MFEHDEVVLEAKHVTRRFPASGGRTLVANDDINLKFYKGKTLGLVGESGCGKSTFMRFLVSLDTPSEGEILYRGKDITKLKGEELRQNRQNIQMVFQDPTSSFNPKMKIRDIVCEPLMNFNRIRKSEKDAACRRLLEMVELPGDFADRYPHNMSGGQRQRVAIARALATDPKVLLCDEATSALDPTTTNSILSLLKELNQKLGVTVVIITHQMSVIEEICTRVAILDGGAVAEGGRVEDIFAHPSTDAARRLVYPGGVSVKQYPTGTRAVRVSFNGGTVYDPLIASLAIDCGVKVTILGADTRTIDGKAFGTMLLLLPDDPNEAAKALSYIRSQPNITAEEVEYHA